MTGVIDLNWRFVKVEEFDKYTNSFFKRIDYNHEFDKVISTYQDEYGVTFARKYYSKFTGIFEYWLNTNYNFQDSLKLTSLSEQLSKAPDPIKNDGFYKGITEISKDWTTEQLLKELFIRWDKLGDHKDDDFGIVNDVVEMLRWKQR